MALALLLAVASCALFLVADAFAREVQGVPVSFNKTGTTEESMAASFIEGTADVSVADDGSATVVLSLNDMAVGYGLEVGSGPKTDVEWGTVVSAAGESPQKVRISVASTEGAQPISFRAPNSPMGTFVQTADMLLDMPEEETQEDSSGQATESDTSDDGSEEGGSGSGSSQGGAGSSQESDSTSDGEAGGSADAGHEDAQESTP
ncbi:MAG: NEAT domain-containing protein, partial [Eggerthellaceae bacterium]|nr:NEAT domain-containing protein [Eggerthellaceae bacterium]